MKKLFGRLKDGTVTTVFTESSNDLQDIEEIFNAPDVSNTKAFDIDIALASDEWFCITPDEEQRESMIAPYLESTESTVDLNPLSGNQYNSINCFYLASKDDTGDDTGDDTPIQIIFNRVYPKYCVISKKFFSFDTSTPALKTETKSVEFSGIVDAYWDGTKLYFKRYSAVKPLFSGLEDLYRQASMTEVLEFLNNDFFFIESSFNLNKIGERARKNIAALLDAGQIDLTDADTRTQYNEYAREYNELDFNIQEDGKFTLTKPVDLSNVINILMERLYTSPITHEKRVAHGTTAVAAS